MRFENENAEEPRAKSKERKKEREKGAKGSRKKQRLAVLVESLSNLPVD